MAEEFFDYKTALVDGDQVVDLHKTGMSYYDDFLSDNPKIKERLAEKNLKGEVVMMSPEEYYQACADYGFPNSHPSVESLKNTRRRDERILNHLKNVLTVYKHRFPMPMLNKADSGQEGLHRMMVIGDMFGWDHKVPVLVVDWADEDLAKQQEHRRFVEKLQYRIRMAVQQTLRYKFANIAELKEQLQWDLDREFEYVDGVETPVKFELEEDGRYGVFVVTVGEATYEFDYEDVQFLDAKDIGDKEFDITDDDLDIDDLELDDTEDFLVRYFGDDWRETHPHLKKTFNIKEELEQDIDKIDNIILENWAYETPGEGCIFIHPNGKFINIYPQLDDHEDLCYWLEENYDVDTPEDAEWFVQEFSYMRCRNSMHLCFVDLPKQATTKQLRSLLEWMETKVSSTSLQVSVPEGRWRKYSTDDYLPEDIFKLIRRYYSSGKLYENKLNI